MVTVCSTQFSRQTTCIDCRGSNYPVKVTTRAVLPPYTRVSERVRWKARQTLGAARCTIPKKSPEAGLADLVDSPDSHNPRRDTAASDPAGGDRHGRRRIFPGRDAGLSARSNARGARPGE